MRIRVGHGYDVHRLEEGRPLILGGVHIPSPRGLAGHSDADVILHAVCDALAGAAGLPDIGQWFPPTDPRHRDADSREFVRAYRREVEGRGWRVAQCDVTVIAEEPRLAPHREAIRASLAELLALDGDAVGCKATTHEGLGALGRGEGIAAWAVVVLEGPPAA